MNTNENKEIQSILVNAMHVLLATSRQSDLSIYFAGAETKPIHLEQNSIGNVYFTGSQNKIK